MSANLLGQEKSPYLLQHKDNPVHWRPWGEAAFAEARAADKPVFLSIGYSTCYWCHVMEKDSFETEAVAEVLNRDFISIKVDREERPDVDEIYMDAVVAMTGHGGWPMSVFLTPDGKPFFGGTFFPRDRFIYLIGRLAEAWQKNRLELLQSSGEILTHLRAAAGGGTGVAETGNTSFGAAEARELFDRAYAGFDHAFDNQEGGFGAAPKFPPSTAIGFLLRYHRRAPDSEALSMAALTLDKMACGGIFDQLGGGFHRYATDEKWLVPHFEKMLYDNALLVYAYSEAFQVTRKPMYADVVADSLAYVKREMTHPEGGFYSAQDAGEVNREGEFYVWDFDEVKAALTPDEFEPFCGLYQLRRNGNFEHGKNILHIADPVSWRERELPLVREARWRLFGLRARRAPPHLDDKILTGWNGLMIAAYAKAYQVFENSEYLALAQGSARFLRAHLWKDGKLLRRYREGDSRFAATAEDYAYLIHGLLHLYESDFDPAWLEWARELQKAQDRLLWDEAGGGYFTAEANDATLILRKKDTMDGAQPSPNSIAALNLLRLFHLTYEDSYRERADRLLAFLVPVASRHPSAAAQLLHALDFATDAVKEIAIAGDLGTPATTALVREVWQTFVPNRVVAVGEDGERNVVSLLKGKRYFDGKPLAYVCRDRTCQNPVGEVSDLRELLR